MQRRRTKTAAERLQNAAFLGAKVEPVDKGSGHPGEKEATDEAIRSCDKRSGHSLRYRIGRGPHPYPWLVPGAAGCNRRGGEAGGSLSAVGRLPDYLIAAVGGGSNAIGLFFPFLEEPQVAMVGVEAGGRGYGLGEHASYPHKGRAWRPSRLLFLSAAG